jgi:hypothetical protein
MVLAAVHSHAGLVLNGFPPEVRKLALPWSASGTFFVFVFAVLGLVLRAYTLSHSTTPSFVKGFSR